MVEFIFTFKMNTKQSEERQRKSLSLTQMISSMKSSQRVYRIVFDFFDEQKRRLFAQTNQKIFTNKFIIFDAFNPSLLSLHKGLNDTRTLYDSTLTLTITGS